MNEVRKTTYAENLKARIESRLAQGRGRGGGLDYWLANRLIETMV